MLVGARLTRLAGCKSTRASTSASISASLRSTICYRISPLTHYNRPRLPLPTITSSHTYTTMASKILNAPSSFVQKPHQAIAHEAVSSPASWRDALQVKVKSGDTTIPTSYDLLKVLVFKPKTSKSATPIPVIVIAGEEAETNAGAIGKKLNLKEMRLASSEVLGEFFGVDKDSCGFLFFSLSLFLSLRLIWFYRSRWERYAN
jgi:hypothetical protein